MPKDPTIAIRDCLAEIAVLHEIEAPMTIETFRTYAIARRAAAYAIQTISEAVRQLPQEWLDDFPLQPWPQIRAIGLDDTILWAIITNETHALKAVMESMLTRHASNSEA